MREVAEALGVSRRTVYKWLARYDQGGKAPLARLQKLLAPAVIELGAIPFRRQRAATPSSPLSPSKTDLPPLEDFLKVVEAAEGQNRVLLWTYFHTAGRRQEILNLKWEDVDFARQRMRLYTRKRKGGNLEADWVDMTDDLTAILREHRESAVNEWVFVRLNKGIGYLEPFLTGRDKWPKDLCRKAEVKPFGCHGIRALTATVLAQGNVPMVAIKQHLRHKNLSVTEAYVRSIASIKPHLRVLEGGGSEGRKVA